MNESPATKEATGRREPMKWATGVVGTIATATQTAEHTQARHGGVRSASKVGERAPVDWGKRGMVSYGRVTLFATRSDKWLNPVPHTIATSGCTPPIRARLLSIKYRAMNSMSSPKNFGWTS